MVTGKLLYTFTKAPIQDTACKSYWYCPCSIPSKNKYFNPPVTITVFTTLSLCLSLTWFTEMLQKFSVFKNKSINKPCIYATKISFVQGQTRTQIVRHHNILNTVSAESSGLVIFSPLPKWVTNIKAFTTDRSLSFPWCMKESQCDMRWQSPNQCLKKN